MMSFKYYCETEELIRNCDFSKLLGIDSEQLLAMELSFFKMLDYRTYVHNKEFIAYKKQIQQLLLTFRPHSKESAPSSTVLKDETE